MTELFRSVKPESTEFPYEAQEDQIAKNFTLVENEPQNQPIKNRQILLSLSFFFILFTQLRNSLCPQVGRFPSLIQSVKFPIYRAVDQVCTRPLPLPLGEVSRSNGEGKLHHRHPYKFRFCGCTAMHVRRERPCVVPWQYRSPYILVMLGKVG